MLYWSLKLEGKKRKPLICIYTVVCVCVCVCLYVGACAFKRTLNGIYFSLLAEALKDFTQSRR